MSEGKKKKSILKRWWICVLIVFAIIIALSAKSCSAFIGGFEKGYSNAMASHEESE